MLIHYFDMFMIEIIIIPGVCEKLSNACLFTRKRPLKVRMLLHQCKIKSWRPTAPGNKSHGAENDYMEMGYIKERHQRETKQTITPTSLPVCPAVSGERSKLLRMSNKDRYRYICWFLIVPYTPYCMFWFSVIIYFSDMTVQISIKRRGVAKRPVICGEDLPARCWWTRRNRGDIFWQMYRIIRRNIPPISALLCYSPSQK